MLTVVEFEGRKYDAEVFELDHHGWPITWSVYDESGEDFSDTLDWQQQEKIAKQLIYTRADAQADRAYEDWKAAQ